MFLLKKLNIFLFNKTEILPLNRTVNLSQVLDDELNHNYKSIGKLFSSSEKITIEKYFIRLKIEKVKELIQLRQDTFSEIGYLLDYNINLLSRPFKEIVCISMTEYKNSEISKRINYEGII